MNAKTKKWLITLGAIVLGSILFLTKPVLYTWDGKVEIPTMDYTRQAVLKKIPVYCRVEPNFWDNNRFVRYWYVQTRYHGYWNSPIYIIDDTLTVETTIKDIEKNFEFKTNSKGDLIIVGNEEFPSSNIFQIYLTKTLQKKFRVHYLEMKFDGYNPKSLVSTVSVHCVVRKSRR